MVRIFLIFIAALSLLVAPVFAGNSAKFGASPGERLTFNIHWMGVPGGHAEIKVKELQPKSYILEAGLESTGVVKFFHPIKEYLRANGEPAQTGFTSDHFFKDQRKGSRIRLTDIKFLRAENIALWTRRGEETQRIEIPGKLISDPLSAFFTLRSLPELQPGYSFSMSTLVDKKCYDAAIRVGKMEKLYTPVGWYDVFPVTLDVPSSDLLQHRGSLVIWLTADQRRLPVRVETQLKVGYAAADLVAFIDGRGGHVERVIEATK